MFSIRDNLYPHQLEMVKSLQNGARYIVASPRTGKTRPAIEFLRDVENVLVLTKKAAVPGWHSELEALGVTGWTVTNYEAVRSKNWASTAVWGALVCDELHATSKYPKPCLVAPIIAKLKVLGARIGISATPCAESYSQLFHQAKALKMPLWTEFKDFYAFFRAYGVPDLIRANGRMLETYKKVDVRAWDEFAALCCVVDRQKVVADFVEAENILCPIETPEVLEMCKTLKRDGILRIGGRVVVAETPLAVAQKCQQICAGVVLDDSGAPLAVWDGKVRWLERFKNARIAILTGFRAEVGAISRMWSSVSITDDPLAFQRGEAQWFVGSIQRFNSGVDLSCADAIVFTSCPWSSVMFIQARERLLRRDRKRSAPVYFPVVRGGIDESIYKIVALEKRDFNSKIYDRASNSKGNN